MQSTVLTTTALSDHVSLLLLLTPGVGDIWKRHNSVSPLCLQRALLTRSAFIRLYIAEKCLLYMIIAQKNKANTMVKVISTVSFQYIFTLDSYISVKLMLMIQLFLVIRLLEYLPVAVFV